MPAALTYPGVYIEEVPSGVRTISGVATSIAAFVGRTKRGPVDKAVTINSYGDFERIFGGLSLYSPLSFAVQDFYLNGGGQAVIVRLFSDPAEATARTGALAGANAVAAAARAAVTDGTVADAAAAADKAKDAIPSADGPGKDAGTKVHAAADAAISGTDKEAVAVAAEGAIAGAVKSTVAEALENSPILAKIALPTSDTNKKLTLVASSPGDWGTSLRVRIDNTDVLDDTKEFNLTIFDAETGSIETFRGLSIDDNAGPRRVDNMLERSALVRARGPLTLPKVHAPAKPGDKIWEDVDDGTDPDKQFSSKAEDGSNGGVLTQDNFAPEGGETDKRGLHALDLVDLFNLLCIPPHELQAESTGPTEGSIEPTLIDSAIRYCEQRRAMLIIDPPASWLDKDAAREGVKDDSNQVGTPHKNAAVYFPAILRPNPLRENREEPFAPCGAVAGVIARTDTQRGIWKAPAGLDAALFGVPGLSVRLNDAENGELNIKGVNCLRTMAGAGRVVWGARTRKGDDRFGDEWKYIPVRRTALFIEESLYRGTQWVVFEPNDEPLWSSIRLNVGSFMNQMFRQGAFQGATPRDAYFVRCDKDTTTQADIDRGVVNILVGFAPLKPAEFVVVRIQQMAGQIQV